MVGEMIEPQDYELLTQAERAQLRARYVEDQGGNCHHCGASLSGEPTKEMRGKRIDWRRFPPNFLRHPVHLHHSHRTGMTIGAVHALCNAILWQYHGE
jgi:hypothetical protein